MSGWIESEKCRLNRDDALRRSHLSQVGYGIHRVMDGETANVPLAWLDVAGVSGNMKHQG